MSGETLAIGLGVFSALTLALVNMIVKRHGDILAMRMLLSCSSALIVLPAAFFVPLPSREVWLALALSVPAHWLYQASLVRAMHRGDLSLVFPIMRGLAPLLVAGMAVFILNETLSPVAIGGLVLATLAVISFSFLRDRNAGAAALKLDRAALFWAAMTAVGVALYNITDARGVRLAQNPLTYIVWLFLLDWILLTCLVIVIRGRKGTIDAVAKLWRPGLWSGFLAVLSFGAALYALSLMEAARVTALRETAIVFASLLGWLILKEGFGARRALASSVLVIGLALMQF